MLKLTSAVLWPSFLSATVASGCFFSLVEPDQVRVMAPLAVYTVGFFFFWAVTALASSLTYYLLAVPGD